MIVYNSNYGTIDYNPLEAHTRVTALPDFSSKIKVSPFDLFTRPLKPESGRLKLPSPFKFSLPCKYLLLKRRSIGGRLSSSSIFFTTETTFLSDGTFSSSLAPIERVNLLKSIKPSSESKPSQNI